MSSAILTAKLIRILESCKTSEQVEVLDAWFLNTVQKQIDFDSAALYIGARTLKVYQIGRQNGH